MNSLPPGPYDVILADPPWRYDFVKVRRWGVEVHYPTLSVMEIAALPVETIAAPDSVLFLWTTSPKLADAFLVIQDWGFTYKTSLIWDKGGLGMGYWVRVNHELLLIATRGKPKCPEVPGRPASVLRAPRRRHSQKPEAVHAIIETMLPAARRLELFARERRSGWDAWGLEVS